MALLPVPGHSSPYLPPLDGWVAAGFSLGAGIPGSWVTGIGLGGQDRDADTLARLDVVRIV